MISSDHWLFAQFTLYTPGFWILFSIVAALVSRLFGEMLAPDVRNSIVITRFFLLPYIGLLLGGLSPRFMGLTGLDWLVSFSLGVGLILVILLALVLARITVAVANPRNYSVTPSPDAENKSPGELIGNRQSLLLSTAVYQIYRSGAEEFHWSFLRGATWELLLALPAPPTLPIYWAIWGGALLALPDIYITNRTFLHRILKVVVLITTSILFLYTRNFWLCWMLHAAGWAILVSGFGSQLSSTATTPTQVQRRL